MREIVTFESRLGTDHVAAALRIPAASGDLTPPSGRIRPAPVTVADVNHGRWVVRCPLVYGERRCPGAELANFTTGLFFCTACRNEAAGHDYLPVRLPGPALRRTVERLLLARPDEETRNWLPGETAADLQLENVAHGV